MVNYDVSGAGGNQNSGSQNQQNEKCVYVLVFQDGQALKHKVFKICESFSPENKRYELPKDGQATQEEYRDEIVKIEGEIHSLN